MKRTQTQAEKKSCDFEQPNLRAQDPLFYEQIQLNKFMSLCDLHHSIIQEYKLSQSCSNKASVCKKGCPNAQKEHKFINNQHESISAKQFYSQFNVLRQAYFTILRRLRDNVIPEFMARIRVQLKELEDLLKEEINSNGLQVVQKLCHVSHKKVNKVLKIAQQPKIEQIELSRLSCKEIYLFRELAKIVPKYIQTLNKEKVNNTINQFVQSGFLKMLKSKGYLQSLINNKRQLSYLKSVAETQDGPIRSQIPVYYFSNYTRIIDVDEIDQIPSRLLQLLSIDGQGSNGEVEAKKKIDEIETFNLKIRSEMQELLEEFSQNQQSNLSSQIKDLQVTILLNQNKVILQCFIILPSESKTFQGLPQPQVLLFNKNNSIGLENNIIIDNLGRILSKCKSMKTLKVYTSKYLGEQSYFQKQLRLYSDGVKISVKDDVSWDGGTKVLRQMSQRKQGIGHEMRKQGTKTMNNNQQYQTLIKLLK